MSSNYGAPDRVMGHQTRLSAGFGAAGEGVPAQGAGTGIVPSRTPPRPAAHAGQTRFLGARLLFNPSKQSLENPFFFFLPWTKVPAAPRLLLALRLPRSAPLVLPRVLPLSRKPWRAALILPCLRGRAKQMPLCLLHPPLRFRHVIPSRGSPRVPSGQVVARSRPQTPHQQGN